MNVGVIVKVSLVNGLVFAVVNSAKVESLSIPKGDSILRISGEESRTTASPMSRPELLYICIISSIFRRFIRNNLSNRILIATSGFEPSSILVWVTKNTNKNIDKASNTAEIESLKTGFWVLYRERRKCSKIKFKVIERNPETAVMNRVNKRKGLDNGCFMLESHSEQ